MKDLTTAAEEPDQPGPQPAGEPAPAPLPPENLINEIAARRRVETVLQSRLALEELIVSISTRFVNLPAEQVDAEIRRALELVGHFSGVERTFINLFGPDTTTITRVYAWLAPGLPELAIPLVGLPTEPFAWVMSQLRRFETIRVDRVAGLPPEARAEKELWQSLNIVSLVEVPLVLDQNLIGFWGFTSGREEKQWLEQDLRLLTVLGQLFVNVLARQQSEEALRRRSHELELLNRAGHAFSSSLDLQGVMTAVLEEIRGLLGVTACSLWLIDPATGELVCRHVTDPHSELVRGWRLQPGQGLAGWVAATGQSLVTGNTKADPRHYPGVDRETGLDLHSIVSVPLKINPPRPPVGPQVIGVIQAVDKTEGRFDKADLRLLELLAATAAIALENARLYEQARQDAASRATLLREVNHRVKNNLAAIIGLLNLERHRLKAAGVAAGAAACQSLIGRVQGLAKAHQLLSAGGWTHVRLDRLAREVIYQSLGPETDLAVTALAEIWVSPDQAHHLALILNELATNAAKYTPALPRLAVHLSQAGGEIRLECRDSGPGYPQEVLQPGPSSTGLGLDLVRQLVTQNLRGALTLSNDNGAVAVIRFKLEPMSNEQ